MSNDFQAAQIDSLLAEVHDLPPEAVERLEGIRDRLRGSVSSEMLPPNIPVDPRAMRDALMAAAEEFNQPQLQRIAEGIPEGHPGVDYHSDPPQPVTHDHSYQPTSRGVPIPKEITG